MRLTGATAVVTGASSGIGRAVALDLAKRGVALALVARDADALEAVAGLVRQRGARVLVVSVDVSDSEAVASAHGRIRAELGEPDVLVNAAGCGVWKPFAAVSDAEHRRMMDVNYWGTFHWIRAALPGMRARRRGAIVNISSGSGKFALAVTSGYSASKFAVTGLSEALHRELRGSGVQISCLHPGSVKTPFWTEEKIPEAGLPPLVRYAPKLSPESVARSVRFCLWFGIPTLTTPVFVSLFAKLNAIWIRLGDLLLWKWFFPAAGAILLIRILLRRLVWPA